MFSYDDIKKEFITALQNNKNMPVYWYYKELCKLDKYAHNRPSLQTFYRWSKLVR